VLDSYAHPRLRVFHRDTTIPPAEHGNFLISEARGQLFLGLSDDDYIAPQFAERAIDLYDRHPDVSFVYSRCWTHVGDVALQSPSGPELEDPLSFFDAYFLGLRHVFWCACVTRTEDLRRLGGLPTGTLIGDMHLWTQLAFSGPVGCVDALLSHYTYLAGNSSTAIPVAAWSGETRELMRRISERLDEMDVPEEARVSLRRAMASYLARTTANQLALNASRGVSKLALLRSVRVCRADLQGNLRTALPRVIAALALPPSVMSRLVNGFVAKRSRWARGT
jgi:hypothetical protein